MPKLWRFQGCSAPFRHCPPHSAWNLIGMPLQEFVDEDCDRVSEGGGQIHMGSARDIYNAFEVKRQEFYRDMTELLSGLLKQFLR